MDAGQWITLGSAVVAALAFVAASFQAKHARQQADAATEQTRLQRAIYEDSLAPSVWVDVRPEHPGSPLMTIILGNSGRSVARNVRVQFEPPLPTGERFLESGVAQARLAEGIASLPPDRTMVWTIGTGFELIPDTGSHVEHRVSIHAEGLDGRVAEDAYVIRLVDQAGTRIGREEGTLHDVVRSIDRLARRMPQTSPSHRPSVWGRRASESASDVVEPHPDSSPSDPPEAT